MPSLVPDLTLRLLTAEGEPGPFLPDLLSFGLDDDPFDVGGGSLTYLTNGTNADLMVDKAWVGVFLDSVELPQRLMLQEYEKSVVFSQDEDRETAETTWGFSTGAQALAEVFVEPHDVDGRAHPREFPNKTFGDVWGTLFQEAQDRGQLLEWDKTFNSFEDSRDELWVPEAYTSKDWPVGTSYLEVWRWGQEMGLADLSIKGWTMRAYNPGTAGRDLTIVDPRVVLHIGRDFLDGPRWSSARELVNRVLVIGDGERWAVREHPESIAIYGVRGGSINASGVTETVKLQAIGDAYLEMQHEPRNATSYKVEFGSDNDPYRVFDNWDWVYTRQEDGIPERVRVRKMGLDMDDDGHLTARLTVNRWWQERDLLLQQRIDALSHSPVAGPAGGDVPKIDRLPPAAPVVTSIVTTSYSPPTGPNKAQMVVTWAAVTLDSDGEPCLDLSHYRVEYKYEDKGWVELWVDKDDLNLTIKDLIPNMPLQVRVRAIDGDGNVSPDVAPAEVETAADPGGFRYLDGAGDILFDTRGELPIFPRQFRMGHVPGDPPDEGGRLLDAATGAGMLFRTTSTNADFQIWDSGGNRSVLFDDDGNAILDGTVVIHGNLTIDAELHVSGDTFLGGTLTLEADLDAAGWRITGAELSTDADGIVIHDDVIEFGAASIQQTGAGSLFLNAGTVWVQGELYAAENLHVNWDAQFDQDVNVSGTFHAVGGATFGEAGFNGQPARGKWLLGAAATDPASTMVLVNKVRTAMQSWGLS